MARRIELACWILGTIAVALANPLACSKAERDFAAATGAEGGSGPGTGSSGSQGMGGASGASGAGGSGGCDPAKTPSEDTCVIDDSLGIFVAGSGNDLNPGTKVAPVQTLAKAISLAEQSQKRIYACAEAFNESIQVPAGIEVFGGLDCQNGWGWIGSTAKTTIATGPDVISVTLAQGPGKTRLEDLWIQSADATVPGGSSIALLAGGVEATIVGCRLVAGNAMPGANGMDAPASAAQAGPPGLTGFPGCNSPSPVPGGAAMPNPACSTSVGGAGGVGTQAGGTPGSAGLPALGAGLGGSPGCTPGQNGAAGMAGTAGAGASGVGTLDATGYHGPNGEDGTAGAPGQGGGGGGGRGMCSFNWSGPGGGSGGAGGCGGAEGGRGRAGGASMALASAGATLSIVDSSLKAGNGGSGGTGGNRQAGGNGGPGGPGGPPSGCPGGDGGKGGNGGSGGGGLGGHSLGIGYTGVEPVRTNVMIEIGMPGLGAPGGTGSTAANHGADGTAAQSLLLGG